METATTPQSLKQVRTALRISRHRLAQLAHESPTRVASMERTWRPSPVSRRVREALLAERCRRRDDRLRVARRARAAALWFEDAPQRVVLDAAAGLLDQEDEHLLADWLLRARPEHSITVATGVAVHALMRGHAAAYDTLMEAGFVNDAVFMDAFFGVSREFVWGPPLSHLAP